ncbi:MAG: hypothetical protein ONB48_15025 [candidate division KSB1 bacterium]|nr:hypothetical protein [candidate division KSB1 bacterium]MDZ7273450.1 hypothetical protein [candidate division KSB1 bacterium]MDZ7286958.1 hypothetical protein [candidate division KSB1 bacterium]MDZ7299689.1 hypothetical protein [candidate division KSB1 bacterium]MDZ7307953.1 hypothetical protein [candidate division KSB1 bacterium]
MSHPPAAPGVDPARFSLTGSGGATRPGADNATAAGRAAKRED